jgi:hypothetical protein
MKSSKNEILELKKKVKQYETFLHNINMMMVCGDSNRLQTLLNNADRWSYAHRIGNGELSDEEQQEIINKAFKKLNEF